MTEKWTRIPDGYKRGDTTITDNGPGLGPSKGSGRWAVSVNGQWLANLDTLAEAKSYSQDEAPQVGAESGGGTVTVLQDKLASAEESVRLTREALERNRGNITEADWLDALSRAVGRAAVLRAAVRREGRS